MLSDVQMERYSRHIILPEIGMAGQRKLLSAKVLAIGAGGLGSTAIMSLAAAGVGKIGIADFDRVDLSNLQRQIIHATNDIGKPKAVSAAETVRALNPEIETAVLAEAVTEMNIRELVRDYDFVLDCTDRFEMKFLVNDACVLERKAFCHAGVLRFYGQMMTFVPGSVCYRCVFKGPPPREFAPNCRQAGVFGPLVAAMGALQAAEAVKFILGKGELLAGRLLTIDAATMNVKTVTLPPRSAACPVCGGQPTISF